MVKTPVPLLYASGAVAERDEELILLLKSVQSLAESAPACEALAVLIARVFQENVSGEDTVVAVTDPCALVESRDETVPVIPRVVVVALVVCVVVKVCVWFHAFAVVVPNARESVGVCPPVDWRG